jgi:ribosomal protein S28E/S33
MWIRGKVERSLGWVLVGMGMVRGVMRRLINQSPQLQVDGTIHQPPLETKEICVHYTKAKKSDIDIIQLRSTVIENQSLFMDTNRDMDRDMQVMMKVDDLLMLTGTERGVGRENMIEIGKG